MTPEFERIPGSVLKPFPTDLGGGYDEPIPGIAEGWGKARELLAPVFGDTLDTGVDVGEFLSPQAYGDLGGAPKVTFHVADIMRKFEARIKALQLLREFLGMSKAQQADNYINRGVDLAAFGMGDKDRGYSVIKTQGAYTPEPLDKAGVPIIRDKPWRDRNMPVIPDPHPAFTPRMKRRAMLSGRAQEAGIAPETMYIGTSKGSYFLEPYLNSIVPSPQNKHPVRSHMSELEEATKLEDMALGLGYGNSVFDATDNPRKFMLDIRTGKVMRDNNPIKFMRDIHTGNVMSDKGVNLISDIGHETLAAPMTKAERARHKANIIEKGRKSKVWTDEAVVRPRVGDFLGEKVSGANTFIEKKKPKKDK